MDNNFKREEIYFSPSLETEGFKSLAGAFLLHQPVVKNGEIERVSTSEQEDELTFTENPLYFLTITNRQPIMT